MTRPYYPTLSDKLAWGDSSTAIPGRATNVARDDYPGALLFPLDSVEAAAVEFEQVLGIFVRRAGGYVALEA